MAQTTATSRISELNQASQAWFAMLAGAQLDLFTPLDNGPLGADELAVVLDVNAEKLSLLLYALVVAGLLTVEDGRFANTDEAATFLVRGKPSYTGSAHQLWAEFGEAGLKAAASVRTGIAQATHDYAAMSEDELFTTLGGLHGAALEIGRTLAAQYGFGSRDHVLDVAGGSGGVSIALLTACPALRATIVELPGVIPIAQRFIDEAGLSKRIDTLALDVLHEPIPGHYDTVVVSKLLQVLSADEAQAALRTIGQAMRPGGKIYIINSILDNSRLTPVADCLLNVVSLSFYEHGQAYTEGEHRAWLATAGFVDILREEKISGKGVLVARKAG